MDRALNADIGPRDDRKGTRGNCGVNIVLAIHFCALKGPKNIPRRNFAMVNGKARYGAGV
jgi:hypothetical protein